MTRPSPEDGVPMLSDRQTEALRESAEPIAVGGESDWEVAVHVYALQTRLAYAGGSVPAGLFVRTVSGKSEYAYPVSDAAAAIAYADETERRYVAWAEANP
ncbi:hypothetical protein AB0M02_10795 [Actinoplanes sp. NPDC051861]|uniref:hypothetical protein n=1 Tax=Actinoplanes sp. NPDC051861 TaxID=3155170 RepID=UPI003436CC43